ncbi:MAG: MFS transporter [Candidatus Ratteibacteria bacterium]
MKSICNNFFLIIILFGIISLLGDIVYEGVRSISGPFLATLGATSLIIGFFSGLGEFLTQSLRLLFGYISDKKKNYLPLMITGYLFICLLPFCGYTDSWKIVIFLLLLERTGKAIRTPSRDTLISIVGKKIGVGRSFGIHELFDQIGAMIGPLIFFISLSKFKSYRYGFNIMWIPLIILISLLIILKKKYTYDGELKDEKTYQFVFRNKKFFLYILFVLFSVCGLVNFQLISYHIKNKNIFHEAFIPILYLIAMGVDGIIAFVVGRLYDILKFKILLIIPFLTFILPFLIFSDIIYLIILGIIFFGIIIGCHETILRAAIADIVFLNKRGFAYGLFNTIYGLGFLISGWIIGFLYQQNLKIICFYTGLCEIIALCFLTSFIFNKKRSV